MLSTWHPPVLYDERLRPSGRSWWWLAVIGLVTFFTLGLFFVPVAILAWFVNVGRFAATRIRVDSERMWVGRRWVHLTALDLESVDRATNPRPWRVFNRRYLGGNPIWTRDSVGIRGAEAGRTYWVAVGTNRRDELLTVLRDAATAAHERRAHANTAYAGLALPPPGWHDDPWDPARIRWWDGAQWSGYAADRTQSPRGMP